MVPVQMESYARIGSTRAEWIGLTKTPQSRDVPSLLGTTKQPFREVLSLADGEPMMDTTALSLAPKSLMLGRKR